MNYSKRRGRLSLTSGIVAVLGAVLAVFTPAAATAATAPQRPGCYMINERCVRFTTITPDTKVFLGFDQSGSATGFVDFNQYKQYVLSTYNLTIDVVGGRVVWPVPRRAAALETPLAPVKFALFYNRGDFTGTAFAVSEPDFFSNLSNVHYPSGGNWNNKVSSVSTRGGAGAGAIICSKPGCAITGWFLILPTGSDVQLLGGLNNTASAVGVP